LELEKEKKEKEIIEQQSKEKETLALLEKERLSNEIDAMNRQLTARILSQSSKNRLIEDILEILPKSGNKMGVSTLTLVRRKLRTELKEDSELGVFLVHFEKINPILFSFLKTHHPDLTTDEIRLLSYIYLDLNTKEIASLSNITPESCKKSVNALLKMGIQTAQLRDYLAGIIY
jgi:hypothetical protein